jgi:hypothetical protein
VPDLNLASDLSKKGSLQRYQMSGLWLSPTVDSGYQPSSSYTSALLQVFRLLIWGCIPRYQTIPFLPLPPCSRLTGPGPCRVCYALISILDNCSTSCAMLAHIGAAVVIGLSTNWDEILFISLAHTLVRISRVFVHLLHTHLLSQSLFRSHSFMRMRSELVHFSAPSF